MWGHRPRLALLCLLPALLGAQNVQDLEKRLTQFALPNGMRFLVLERHQAPVVSFDMFVNVGAVDDPPGQSSMAHMFEHMIGKGTRSIGTRNWQEEHLALEQIEQLYDKLEAERRRPDPDKTMVERLEKQLNATIEKANSYVEPNAFPRVIEESGGVGFNAGTAQDYTTYFYSLPSNKLELWFLLQSDWLRRPVLREFYKERDVVREERRMRVESSSQGRLIELMLATAFMAHPYRNLIGWASEIENLRARDAEAFFRRYYVPGNVTVAVVGDVNPADVKRYAERYFASIPAGPLPPRVDVSEPPQQGQKRAELRTEEQPVVVVGYRRPSQFHKDDAVFDVISSILSSGRTGWLYQDLVRDKRISIGAGAVGTFPGGKYPNLFMLVSVPARGKTPEENEQALYAVLDRLRDTKVDDETLNRVKTKVRAGLIRQLDSNQGLASQLTYYQTLYGNWRRMFDNVQEVTKVTADDVQRVAREYFVDTGRTVAYTKTKGAAQ